MSRRIALFALVAAALAATPAAGAPQKPGPAKAAKPATPREPLDVTREFYKALHAGNAKAAAKLTAGDGAEPALRSFVQISTAYLQLESALAKRFGADAAAEVGYGRKVQDEIKSLLGASVEVEGPTARVAAMDGHTITTLRNVKGAWRVELEDALETPEGRAAFAAQARATAAASKDVVALLKAGKYADPRAAIDDFEGRVSQAAGAAEKGTAPGATEPAEEGGAQL